MSHFCVIERSEGRKVWGFEFQKEVECWIRTVNCEPVLNREPALNREPDNLEPSEQRYGVHTW